jgi:capsular polysaccharide transport system permease protein
VLAAGYYIGIAADQYVSEFKFVVRDAKSAAAGTSSNANAPLGLESLSSVGAGSVESYMVAEYIGSRQAVDALQEKIRIKQLYDKPDADWLSRFDSSRSTESFVKYWNRMVSATYDQVTGLGTAEVRAFSAEDAYAIATSLVALSEALVNDIANRPQQDAIRSAEKDVRRAEDRLTKVRTELAKFRNTENVIEPGANVVSSNVSLAQSLRTSISGIETELSALRRQKINPGSPVVSTLELRLRALRDQLTYVEKQVGSYNVDGKPLSAIVAAYEALDLERQFAQNMVLATMQNLEQARANAAMQHMYVATFVKPAMPQSPTYPRRTTAISLVVLASLLAWLVGLLIVDSIREHLT